MGYFAVSCVAPPTTTEAPNWSDLNTFDLYTNDSNEFSRVLMVTELDHFLFTVGACSDAYVILHTNPGVTDQNAYHIVLGTENNQKSEIRKKGENTETKSFDTPNLLRCLSAGSKVFFLTWRGGEIIMRENNEQGREVFSWVESEFDINAIALGSRHAEMAKWTVLRSQGKDIPPCYHFYLLKSTLLKYSASGHPAD